MPLRYVIGRVRGSLQGEVCSARTSGGARDAGLKPGDILGTIAEIAITLAGFTGLIAAFRRSGVVSRGGVLGVEMLISLVLLLAACGVLLEPSAGLLVLACTWGLVFPAIGFVLTFVVVTRGSTGHEQLQNQ